MCLLGILHRYSMQWFYQSNIWSTYRADSKDLDPTRGCANWSGPSPFVYALRAFLFSRRPIYKFELFTHLEAGSLDAKYPPGTCVMIYPQKKELSTTPIVSGVHVNSGGCEVWKQETFHKYMRDACNCADACTSANLIGIFDVCI